MPPARGSTSPSGTSCSTSVAGSVSGPFRRKEPEGGPVERPWRRREWPESTTQPNHRCVRRVHIGVGTGGRFQFGQPAGVVGVAVRHEDMPNVGGLPAQVLNGVQDSPRVVRGARVDHDQAIVPKVYDEGVHGLEWDSVERGEDLL